MKATVTGRIVKVNNDEKYMDKAGNRYPIVTVVEELAEGKVQYLELTGFISNKAKSKTVYDYLTPGKPVEVTANVVKNGNFMKLRIEKITFINSQQQVEKEEEANIAEMVDVDDLEF